jgi:hypothetical protein
VSIALAHPDCVVTGGADCVVVGEACVVIGGWVVVVIGGWVVVVIGGWVVLVIGGWVAVVTVGVLVRGRRRRFGSARAAYRLVGAGGSERRQRAARRRRAAAVVGPGAGHQEGRAEAGRCGHGEQRQQSGGQLHVVNFRVAGFRQRRAFFSLPPTLR